MVVEVTIKIWSLKKYVYSILISNLRLCQMQSPATWYQNVLKMKDITVHNHISSTL